MMELVAATSSAVSPPAPRRGRREKPWPPGKQKKLLRLYVCTQSERLPLVRILERLKDGSFDPRCVNPLLKTGCWRRPLSIVSSPTRMIDP